MLTILTAGLIFTGTLLLLRGSIGFLFDSATSSWRPRVTPKPDYLKIQALEWELGIEGAEESGSVSRAKTVRAMSELVSQSYHELVRYDLPANQVVGNCAICHRLRRSRSGFYPHEHMGYRPTPYEQTGIRIADGSQLAISRVYCILCDYRFDPAREYHYHVGEVTKTWTRQAWNDAHRRQR